MTKFTGTDGNDQADAATGDLIGFAGGTLAQLQDLKDDLVRAEGGDDSVLAGGGNDRVFGGAGHDLLAGGAGSDVLYGGTGNDTLTVQGDGLTDQLFGGSGADVMIGGNHNDIFEGGGGTDSLYGGTNVDIFRFLDGDDIDYIDAGGKVRAGIDTLELSFVTLRGAVVNLEAGVWQLGSGPQQTILNLEQISGTQMGDVFTGTARQEGLFGHAGNDVIHGRAGIDMLTGDDGEDRLWGEAGKDQVYGGLGRDLVFGGAGNDRVDGGGARDRVAGGVGDDVLLGGDGNDQLRAGRGADHLWGDEGNDLLLGGTRADVLDGGTGSDTMRGGGGADEFWFTNDPPHSGSADLIADFDHGVDLIRFRGAGSGSAFGVLGQVVEDHEIVNGTAAVDGDDYLIYDAQTGTIYLDTDGSGTAQQRAFAVLAQGPGVLTALDFLIIP